jgi:hypothetical protein
MQTVLFIMAFANFVFWPLVIGFVIALIIEQVLRRGSKYYMVPWIWYTVNNVKTRPTTDA